MTPRQQALVGYFYTVASDPRLKAAGYSPTAFGKAFLGCVSDDLAFITEFALRGTAAKAETKVRRVARVATSAALGGAVPPEVAGRVVETLDEAIGRGFRELGEAIDRRFKKAKAR